MGDIVFSRKVLKGLYTPDIPEGQIERGFSTGNIICARKDILLTQTGRNGRRFQLSLRCRGGDAYRVLI